MRAHPTNLAEAVTFVGFRFPGFPLHPGRRPRNAGPDVIRRQAGRIPISTASAGNTLACRRRDVRGCGFRTVTAPVGFVAKPCQPHEAAFGRCQKIIRFYMEGDTALCYNNQGFMLIWSAAHFPHPSAFRPHAQARQNARCLRAGGGLCRLQTEYMRLDNPERKL